MSELEFTRYADSSVQKLNTQSCCFLCFKFKNDAENKEINGHEVRRSFSIRHLLRYLQIKPKSIIGSAFGSFHCQAGNIKADSCEHCGNKMKKFSALFLQLEKVEMEMKSLLEEIHQSISQSAMDTVLVQNCSKKMSLAQLAFVDNLRRQLAKESK